MKRVRIGAFLLLVAVLAAPTAVAQDGDAAGAESRRQLDEHRFGPNILVTIVIGEIENSTQARTYRLVARDRGPRSELLIGWRMPIPVAQSEADDNAEIKTEYIYQNVGVTARVRVELLDDGRVLVEGEIEASGSRDDRPAEHAADSPPIIGTFQQALSVLMRQNEPLRVAEVPDPEGGSLYVQLEVDVQE